MSANAEIIAELRRVLNERDEAREQLDLTKRELGRWVDRETKAVRERDSYQRQLDAIGDAIVTSITKRIEPRISRHPVTVVMAAGSLIAKIGEAIGCEFEDGDDLLEAVKELVRECDEARAACPDCAMWAERSARWHDDMQRAERERDEARADAERYLADLRRCASEPYERTRELEALQAEVERLRETKDYLRTWLSSEELEGLRVKAAEHPLLWEEIHHLKAEVERLREMAHDFEAMREDRDEARAERDAAIARITEVGVMVATNGNRLAKDAYRSGAEAMRTVCMGIVCRTQGLDSATAIRLGQLICKLPIQEEP